MCVGACQPHIELMTGRVLLLCVAAPEPPVEAEAGTFLSAIGWGQTNTDTVAGAATFPDRLQEVRLQFKTV